MEESPPTKIKRRHVLMMLGGAAALASARLGCFRLARPAQPAGPLSDGALALIEKAWRGLDPKRMLDYHVHVVGMGVGGTGCYVNPRMTQYLAHPIDYAKFDIYRKASGVESDEKCDVEYVDRLASLVRSQKPHGRALIFAFDQLHDDDGKPVPEQTEFYTPNDYVLQLAKDNPDAFVPCASIHPYRADAADELHRVFEAGAVAVKWLPNAMNIDPSSEKCDRFYEAMAKLGVPLITHAGEEKAVEAEEAQRLGNPLFPRRPLDHGVKVVVAHCASLGQNPNLDAMVDGEGRRPWANNFDLWLRLMAEPKYEGLLFGDISAMPQVNRVGVPLQTVLMRPELHKRLVNGSDYPLPAINVLMQTSTIEDKGFISETDKALLDEIDQHNPLLFDFVLKRAIRWVEGGKEHRFADDIFMVRPEVFPPFKVI